MRKAGSKRGGLLQNRTHQPAVQGQMVSPESINTSNIMEAEQVIFTNIYVYVYIHVITVTEKKTRVGRKAGRSM